jgi:hypothetical protein
MGSRIPARLIRMLTILVLLAGMQADVALPSGAGVDMAVGAVSMQMQGSGCKACGDGAMPAAQCAAACGFTLLASIEPVAVVPVVKAGLRPSVAAILAGWSIAPDTAPPRV